MKFWSIRCGEDPLFKPPYHNQKCIQSDSVQPCTMFIWSPKPLQKWKSPHVKKSTGLQNPFKSEGFPHPLSSTKTGPKAISSESQKSPPHLAKSSTGPKILSKVKVSPSHLALLLLQLPRVSFNQVSINPSLTSHTIDPLNFLESDQDFYFYICLFPFFLFLSTLVTFTRTQKHVQIYEVCLSKAYWLAVVITFQDV